MINRNHKVSISTQAQLLGFSRGMVYYKPKAISETTLVLMHAIDRLRMEYPFMGARMLCDHLNRQGHTVDANALQQAKESLSRYLGWYNSGRLHSSLGKQTPDEAYAKWYLLDLVA